MDYEPEAGTTTRQYEYRKLSNLSLKGPNANGTMSGVRWVSNLWVDNCFISGFKNGLYTWGDHQLCSKSFLTENYYGVYVPAGQPTEFDQAFISTVNAGNSFAAFGVAAGAYLSAEIFDGHFGFQDHGLLYAETDAPNSGCIDGLSLHACYVESFGTSVIYTNNRWINDFNFHTLRLLPNTQYDGAGTAANTAIFDLGTGGLQDLNGCSLLIYDPAGAANPPTAGQVPLCFITAGLMRRVNIHGAQRFMSTVLDWPSNLGTDGWPIFGSNGTIEDVIIEWGRNKLMAVKVAEDVGQYESAGLDSFQGQALIGQRGLAGDVPLGIYMYQTTSGFTAAVQYEGIINADSTGAITEGAYVEIASTGLVQAATSATDLPILGIAGDGGASGGTCPVYVRISD